MASPMKRLRAVAVAVLATLVVGIALLVAALLRGGITARSEPSRIEATVARYLRHLAIPARAREQVNPIPPSGQALTEARAHFADHCASCHANDGSGGTPLGRSLYPRAPDMRREDTRRLTDGELFYIIENGVRFTGMPAWGQPGKESESWKLVHFIRHLPALTSEEKLEMERLNPRGLEEWKQLEEEDRFLEGAGPGPASAGGPPSPATRHRHREAAHDHR